jgi:hypothetical protein
MQISLAASNVTFRDYTGPGLTGLYPSYGAFPGKNAGDFPTVPETCSFHNISCIPWRKALVLDRRTRALYIGKWKQEFLVLGQERHPVVRDPKEFLMLRKLLSLAVVGLIFTGILLADEAKGKFKKWGKGTITVTVGDKEQDFKVGKDAKIFHGEDEVKGKDRRQMFKDLKEGNDVTITYDKEGDKMTVKEVKIKK